MSIILHLSIIFLIRMYITTFKNFRVVSILTVFVNKALLSSKTVNLDAPLFVTWFQCIVSVTICITLRKLSQWFPRYIDIADGSPFRKDIFKKVYIISSNNIIITTILIIIVQSSKNFSIFQFF